MRRTKATQATQATADTEIQKPDEQWRHELTRQQYDVLRRARTEPAFTGKYVHAKENGSYCCAGCGNELFRSDAKFASGTGWPSFYDGLRQRGRTAPGGRPVHAAHGGGLPSLRRSSGSRLS